MAKYIIKNNLPKCDGTRDFKYTFGDIIEHETKKVAIFYFNEAISLLKDFETKTFLRSGKDLRGTIKVEIDGFFYYVELYKEK